MGHRATVLEVDDRGFSAILKVHEYYKGEGPEWLAVVRYPVGLQTARRVRGYPTAPCLYAGYARYTLRCNQFSVQAFGLLRPKSSNGDGTFTDSSFTMRRTISFSTASWTASYLAVDRSRRIHGINLPD